MPVITRPILMKHGIGHIDSLGTAYKVCLNKIKTLKSRVSLNLYRVCIRPTWCLLYETAVYDIWDIPSFLHGFTRIDSLGRDLSYLCERTLLVITLQKLFVDGLCETMLLFISFLR